MQDIFCAENKKIFGEKLRELRKSKRQTLKEFAATLDVSYGFLGAVERGEKEPGKYLMHSLEQFCSDRRAEQPKPLIAFNQEEYGTSYTAEELELIKYYRQLCPDQKLMIIPMMKGLLNSPTKSEENGNTMKALKAAS